MFVELALFDGTMTEIMKPNTYSAKKKRNTLFIKQLVSYLVILCIPLLMLNTFYFITLMQTYKKGVLNTATVDTHHALVVLENELETMRKTVELFQMTSGFKSYLATSEFFT